MLILIGMLLLAWLLMVAATLWLRWGGETSPRNSCIGCGYDFLALPGAEVCPECGIGRYDEPPRREWGWGWGRVYVRAAIALAVALAPAAAVFGSRVAGVRNLHAPLGLLPEAAEGLFAALVLIGAMVKHASICWAILGPHAGGVRGRWLAGHAAGAVAIAADVGGFVTMVMSATS